MCFLASHQILGALWTPKHIILPVGALVQHKPLFITEEDFLKLVLAESQPEVARSKPGFHVERREQLGEVGPVGLELQCFPQNPPDFSKLNICLLTV